MAPPKLPPEERKHNEAWEYLKSYKYLRIEIPRSRHKSYSVLLRREANKDTEFFKLLTSQDKSFKLSFASLGDILFVSIVYSQIKRKEI